MKVLACQTNSPQSSRRFLETFSVLSVAKRIESLKFIHSLHVIISKEFIHDINIPIGK